MEITALREKLHSLINTSSEDKLQHVYELLEEENEYSDEFKNILEEEYTAYLKDGAVISRSEINEAVEKLIQKK
ncbi:MAG TPA: hypothetical protein VHP12_00475 [Chitinophagaceae bacterium]|nr:hypothetical protein [Chitinophagaceae bacterium]